ncbi:NADH-quinone oxidoreductase subunit NuoF [Alkaliphilus pronyensis]|uniref:NADH-quinone oxidoreductase subunit NuoF n=1 Tax=Alkaliphilus pronyensis TaxID=1482732 RepID=A0A6I0F1P3_9FIRM|nr:NADH-quinone oxidoreductase subunit NuoF [Alkaliphilus pronyensis]KAB3534882.1 NADH-quinone oxidoreductase subunit NuoF [Alkaliphilus pronyensis]
MKSFVSKLCGKIMPLSLKEYREHGGFLGLEKALFYMSPQEVIDEIKESRLRGRGGASFPTGVKWQLVAAEGDEEKYVVCNADEGEPGTFKDKALLEGCPFQVIEGLMISAYAVGAYKGYIYIRGEYPNSIDLFKKAINILKKEGYLGENILGQNFSFDIEVRSGAGAYVCGEETALIESIEGNSGSSRFKPPYPPNCGLWGKPTLVNNVETLANIPLIISQGAEEFLKLGTKGSKGTKLISVSGNVVNKGVFEVEFGISLREIIYDICGGLEGNKKLKFIQVGGSSGACLPELLLDLELDFDEFKKHNIGIGSGAILVVDDSCCILDFMRVTTEFFKHESCGKCTTCREGNRHIIKAIDRMIYGSGTERDMQIIKDIATIMRDSSLCGLGQAAPIPVLSLLKHFKDEFQEHINGYCSTGVCNFKGEGKSHG